VARACCSSAWLQVDWWLSVPAEACKNHGAGWTRLLISAGVSAALGLMLSPARQQRWALVIRAIARSSVALHAAGGAVARIALIARGGDELVGAAGEEVELRWVVNGSGAGTGSAAASKWGFCGLRRVGAPARDDALSSESRFPSR